MPLIDLTLLVFQLLILLFSVVIHEVAHGATALALGDTTARDAKRLTLNPLRHLDPFGSVILPVTLLALSAASGGGGVIFGWAKPVPYNPFVFRNPRLGSAIVGAAGPLSNLLVAFIFAIGFRLLAQESLLGFGAGSIAAAFASIVFINVFLAVFNLVPVPPLDGSKLLFALLSDRYIKLKLSLERYGLIILIVFIFSVASFIGPIARDVVHLLLGV